VPAYPSFVECTQCGGKGELPVRRDVKCPTCQARRVTGEYEQAAGCPTCGGTGKVTVDAIDRCRKCLGRGGSVVLSAEEERSFTGIDPIGGEAAVAVKAEEKGRQGQAGEQEVTARPQKRGAAVAGSRRGNVAMAAALAIGGGALWLVSFYVLDGSVPCRSVLIAPVVGAAAFVIVCLMGRR
jgi:hypothetical protein